jgi:hypothetical protein
MPVPLLLVLVGALLLVLVGALLLVLVGALLLVPVGTPPLVLTPGLLALAVSAGAGSPLVPLLLVGEGATLVGVPLVVLADAVSAPTSDVAVSLVEQLVVPKSARDSANWVVAGTNVFKWKRFDIADPPGGRGSELYSDESRHALRRETLQKPRRIRACKS